MTVLVIAAGFYLWQQQQKKEDPKPTTSVEQTDKQDSKESEVPSNYKSLKLNDITISFPRDWGIPTTEEIEEDLGEIAFRQHKGEMANLNDWETTMYVTDMDSFENDSYLPDVTKRLKKIYENQSIQPEEIYLDNGSYLPPPMAGVLMYNPRYIENTDASMRGFWYLANVGQDLSTTAQFVAILYDKERDKVVTIDHSIDSKETKKLQDKAATDNPDMVAWELRNYMLSAYFTDSEVKKAVDEECLKVVELLK